MKSFRISTAICIVWIGFLHSSAFAERPSAPEIFPSTTYAMFHIPDIQELGERMQGSAMFAMFSDDEVRPVIEQLYGSVSPSMEAVEEQIGIKIEELLDLPLGEMALGVVGMPGQPPALVILIESADNRVMNDLVDRGRTMMVEAGFEESTETMNGSEVLMLTRTDGEVREMSQLQVDETLIFATNKNVMNAITAALAGDEEQETLSTVDAYNTILTRCQSQNKAMVSAYMDPIGLIRSAAQGNVAAVTGLAILPVIGLDGLLGIGGTMQLPEGDFDTVLHGHLLLDQPRSGVIEMMAFKNGETTPETWVPADVANYTTFNFGVIDAYTVLRELVDSFQGENAFENFVDGRITEELGINLTDELMPAMAGRFSLTTWYEKPASLTSQANALGIELKDVAEFQGTLDKIIDKFSDRIEERPFGGTTIYEFKPDSNDFGDDDQRFARDDSDEEDFREARQRRQRERPAAAAIVGDYLILCNKGEFIEQAILTNQDQVGRLADELDFKLIANRIQRQPGANEACVISFERPDEGLRYAYDLLLSDEVREGIAGLAEENPFFETLNQNLSENRIPPFEVMAKYLAPGGTAVTNEESGFHFVAFTLKRQGNSE